MRRLEKAQGESCAFVAVDDRPSSLMQTFLARQAGKYPANAVDGPAGQEAKFDPNDILGWAGSLFDWLKRIRTHAWYWGDEHHCILYDKRPIWNLHGRCIGHTRIPLFPRQFFRRR